MAIDRHKLLNDFYLGRVWLAESVLRLVSFRFVRIYLLLLFILNVANWFLALYVNQAVSQSLVVLHYNVNLGVNLIGRVGDIYIIPTLGLSFIVINFLLLLNLFKRSRFIAHLLLGFTLPANLFLIAGTIAIYLINFR